MSSLPSYIRFIDLILEYVPLDLIMDFTLTEQEDERVGYLLYKNSAGDLTSDEKAELEDIAEFEGFVSTLKIKALAASMKQK